MSLGMLQNDIQPTEFLSYQESIEKIKDILAANKDPNIITFLLRAQLKVLKYLNDENFNCLVPWDKRTGLPSHPSMAADAQKYMNFYQCSDDLKSVLNSFLCWSLFAREELICCCGGSLLKPRKVSLDIMLNHVLRVEVIDGDYCLVVKQLVGAGCSNKGHLKNHYNFGKMSQLIDNLSIIFIAEICLNLKSSKIDSRLPASQKADQFNLEEFERRIALATDEI